MAPSLVQLVGVRTRLTRERIAVALTLAGAAGVGLLVEAVSNGIGPLARPEFSLVTSLPLVTYPIAAASAVVVALLQRYRWAGLAFFFLWMPFEDLVRKFGGNDLRIYFVKDAILAIAVLGLLPHLKDRWRRGLGLVRRPTLAVFGVAIVMSIPAAVHDLELPAIAFHTRFLFALLLPVGVYVAEDKKRLSDTLFWLTLLTAAVSLLGVVQAVIGPTFLNPSLESAPFEHLTVERTEGAYVVLRPSGPFADVSRFASWTIISVVLSLSSARASESFVRRRMSIACLAISLAAVFASASRASLIVTAVILIASVTLSPSNRTRLRIRPVLGLAAAAIFATSLGGQFGQMYRATSDFFFVTINPWSSGFEVATRVNTYVGAILDGVVGTDGIGTGTGTESVGKRYLGETFKGTNTESGWGSVAAEWGLLGLAIWVWFTAAWVNRALRSRLAEASASLAAATLPLALWVVAFLTLLFSLGIGLFENYVANAFFWFLSGIVFASTARSEVQPSERPLSSADRTSMAI